MALIKNWSEFRNELRDELKIQGDVEDNYLLATANEVLAEICSSTSNLRDLRFDVLQAFAVTGTVTLSGTYIHEIEQVYYQKFNAGVFQQEWELTEMNGLIVPPPIAGPDSYVVFNNSTGGTIEFVFNVGPTNLATAGDKLRVVGTGYKYITDITSQMPYVSFYPMLKRSILQRMQIKRNVDPQKIQVVEPSIQRAQTAAGMGSQDKEGNTIKQ